MTRPRPKQDRVVELIGVDAFDRLLKQLGGRRLHVPEHAGTDHYLTVIIGREATDKLCAEFSNDRIDLPLRSKKRELVLQALAKGMPKTKIAEAFLVTERYVYKVQAEDGVPDDPKQMRLF